MFVIRRVYDIKPGMARKYASVLRRVADAYEASGQRSSTQVYYNDAMIPGKAHRVYIQWTADAIESQFREGNVVPAAVTEAALPGDPLVLDTWIEFYEMMTPSKMVEA